MSVCKWFSWVWLFLLSSSPVLSPVQVSLLNYVFLASWAFALPYSQYRPLASSICTVWTCVIIVCKMLYQLKSIDPRKPNCTIYMVNVMTLQFFGPCYVHYSQLDIIIKSHLKQTSRHINTHHTLHWIFFHSKSHNWEGIPQLVPSKQVCVSSEPTTHIFCPQPNYTDTLKTEMKQSLLYEDIVEPTHWVGLKKVDDLLDYLRVRIGNIHQLRGWNGKGVAWQTVLVFVSE